VARASDDLLRWLRRLIQERKLTAASLAEAAGIPRNRARHVLTGTEPMTVDELLMITHALKLSPADFARGATVEEAAPAGPSQTADAGEPVLDEEGRLSMPLDPLGNHVRQLFEIGFLLGVDFLFLARTSDLVDSNVPQNVLDQHGNRDLPIKLDAAYHQHNKPRYEPDGITLTLSFDALYECRFPWRAIHKVIFLPMPPEAPVEEEPEVEPPAPKGRPHLRLVE
jgi:transcriptional regulator with XRE-family HTH domain